MSGLVFYRTADLKMIRDFYINFVNAKLWLDQGKCIVLQHGNFLFGFCQDEEPEGCGIITFFYPSTAQVNRMYDRLKDVTEAAPRKNEEYRIYHFFARDPEGRRIEFQTFLHHTEDIWSGSQLLRQRRSIREFTDREVSEEILLKILDVCRYSPTSMNTQAYYYVFTADSEKKILLSEIRERSSSPLARAPLVVAVCSEPERTRRPEQDACIAAYHLLLAAAQYGLGTCWITDMNRPEVKDILGIPEKDYIACLTPLGYYEIPDMQSDEEVLKNAPEVPELPVRREVKDIFRFV